MVIRAHGRNLKKKVRGRRKARDVDLQPTTGGFHMADVDKTWSGEIVADDGSVLGYLTRTDGEMILYIQPSWIAADGTISVVLHAASAAAFARATQEAYSDAFCLESGVSEALGAVRSSPDPHHLATVAKPTVEQSAVRLSPVMDSLIFGDRRPPVPVSSTRARRPTQPSGPLAS